MVQQTTWTQNHYFFSKKTANEGLPSTKTYFTFQDSRGYVWISTHSGLSRYDGHTFRNYNIMDGLNANMVLAIAEDEKKRLWLATGKGTNIFDGKRFIALPKLNIESSEIVFTNDTAYLATEKGLYMYKDTNLLKIFETKNGLPGSTITSLLGVEDGLFVGTDKGICFLHNGRISTFWKRKDNSYIMSMLQARDGTIWFCTVDGDVFYYRNGLFQQLHHAEEGKHNTFKIIQTQKGDIVLMHGQYLNVFGNDDFLYSLDNFIKNRENAITDVKEDQEGNLWITSIYGVFIGRKTKIKNINLPEKSVRYMFVSEFDGEFYVVGNRKIWKLQGDSIYEEVFKDKPPQWGELSFVMEYKKDEFLFAATIGGLLQYKDGEYTKLTQGYKLVHDFFKKGSRIWIITNSGFCEFKNDSLYAYPLEQFSFDKLIYFDMAALNERENLLTSDVGLFKFSDEGMSRIPIEIQGNKMPFCKKLLKMEDGSYLMGTKGYGLLNISIENDSAIVNYLINSRNSILNDDIMQLLVDENNTLWVTSSGGLFKIYNLQRENQFIEYIGSEDGLPAHSWSYSYLLDDKKGSIYLSGSEGISKMPVDLTSYAPEVQNTHITSVKILGETFDWGLEDSLLNFEALPSDFHFKHDQNALVFHFSGLNFYKPQSVVYQFKLEGLENSWTYSSTSFASYSHLPAGDYNFKVRSGTNLQTVDKQPLASFTFTIEPPFWQTWWFILLAFFVVGLLIYSIYRYRLNEQMQKQKVQLQVARELNENKLMAFQARMNPHFVFNSLNSIQYFITRNDKVSSLTYLSKFAKLLRQIVDNSIQPKISLEEEIEMLKSYIEMEEMRFDKSFSSEIDLSDDLEVSTIEIPAMILQPFVENAILHGLLHKNKGGKLHISFSKEGRQVICTIEDNGIGRVKSTELNRLKHKNHQSQGTKFAKKRLELLSDLEEDFINTVEFVDLYDDANHAAGTRVIVKIPIL